MEVSFARKLKENGYNPAIFNYSLGSTSIASNWKQPGGGNFFSHSTDGSPVYSLR